jgi:hypothetical protein
MLTALSLSLCFDHSSITFVRNTAHNDPAGNVSCITAQVICALFCRNALSLAPLSFFSGGPKFLDLAALVPRAEGGGGPKFLVFDDWRHWSRVRLRPQALLWRHLLLPPRLHQRRTPREGLLNPLMPKRLGLSMLLESTNTLASLAAAQLKACPQYLWPDMARGWTTSSSQKGPRGKRQQVVHGTHR